MSAIDDAVGQKIVAVVGAGHVPGMVAGRGEPVDREKLSEIPAASSWTKWLKWIIPALVLGAFAFGYQKHSGQNLEEMFWAWVLPNSIMAGLLAAVGGAKFLSIITAIIASPITSLNPTIGAGMVVGLVEAWLRKPTVEDAERLSQDMLTLAGVYKNPFSRVLLVAALATIGSSLGAFVGAPLVLALLG